MEQLQSLTYGKSFLISIVFGAIYFFVFYNDGKLIEADIAKVRKEVLGLNKELKEIDQAVKDAERFNQTMASLGEEMVNIQKAIPAEIDTTDLMRIVSTEAKVVGVNINNLTAGTLSKASKGQTVSIYYEPISVSVSLGGKYNQIMLFLSNLTKVDKIITSKNISLSSASKGKTTSTGNPDIQMTANLQAYRYLAEPPPDPKLKKRTGGAKK